MNSSHVIYKFGVFIFAFWFTGCQIPPTTPELPETTPTIPLPSAQPEPQSPTETPHLLETDEVQTLLPLISFETEPLGAVVPIPEKIELDVGSGDFDEDILKQIGNFFPAGGGGSAGCMLPPENYEPGDLHWADVYLERDQNIAVTSLWAIWCVCGLTNEPAEATLVIPSGEIKPLELIRDDYYNDCANLEVHYGPGSILGRYQLNVVQSEEELVDDFNLVMPEAPVGVWWENSAWFVGFNPGEQVHLLVYGEDEIPMGEGISREILLREQQVTADKNGMLLVSIDQSFQSDSILVFEVIRSSGSLVSISNKGHNQLNLSQYLLEKECGNSLPPRLDLGGYALPTQIEQTLRDSPSVNDFYSLGSLDIKINVEVIDGPVCNDFESRFTTTADGYWFWLIATPDGQVGWVMECDNTQYYLEPVNK